MAVAENAWHPLRPTLGTDEVVSKKEKKRREKAQRAAEASCYAVGGCAFVCVLVVIAAIVTQQIWLSWGYVASLMLAQQQAAQATPPRENFAAF